MFDKPIVCFKCEKELQELCKDESDSHIPMIADGGFARLTFGYGSKFDMGGTGHDDPYPSYGGQLLDILSSNRILVPICDDCFEKNLNSLVVLNKIESRVEFKRIQ